jgi:1D-myo-inositol-tetrakisphosphate 5-kinase/inositol-polyphosphate multikinase
MRRFPLHPDEQQVYDNITCQHVRTPKSYGKSIKAAQLGEGIAKFFPVGSSTSISPSSSSGLPKETLEPILRAIYDEIAEIRQVCSSLEIRMVGASLLIIYEADWTRAEQSLTSSSEEEDEKGEDDDMDEDDDDDDDDDDVDESNSKRPGPPFVVKLIDFAHTRLAPGEGPDQGVLFGMDTVLRLLDARLQEIASGPS